MRIVNSSTLPIIINIIITIFDKEFKPIKSKLFKSYIEELTVFIKVKIPNLNDSSKFIPRIESKDVILIRDGDKSDPASVVFKSIEYANKNNIDVVIIDTAGRLQNKTDLMDQLGKIDRVLKKHDETLPHDSIISIDATTGQNALKQVEEFNKFTKITGIIMTKFDSNAAGGTLVSISNKTKIPILAIGSGEQISDLIDFDPEQFSNNFVKD